MTTKELIAAIAADTDISKTKAKEVLDSLASHAAKGLQDKGEFKLHGNIGTLKLKEMAERKGRNPQTGEEIQIPARKAVKFTPSQYLKVMVK